MNTTHDLRDALHDQERHAPAEIDILAELNRRRSRHRIPRWGAGLLAAAAVAAIVVGVSGLAGPHTTNPVTPAVVIAPATSPAPMSAADPTPHSSDVQQAQEQQAAQAAQSAMSAAETARDAIVAQITACTRVAASATLVVNGRVDGANVMAVATACARIVGARPGYVSEWVETTTGPLADLITPGQAQTGKRPVIAVQIRGIFAGQGEQTDTMLLKLFPDGKSPAGVEITTNPVDLATLGTVHQ